MAETQAQAVIANSEVIKREYLVHYLDASFGSGAANYVRLGKDLEDFAEELNPDVETKKNIWGEQTVNHNGYEVSSEVDPYYARKGDALFEKLEDIAIDRKRGANCETTMVTARVDEDGQVIWARREDVMVIPKSIGGGTDGYQIPFGIYNNGNRVKGTWSTTTKTFTPDTE